MLNLLGLSAETKILIRLSLIPILFYLGALFFLKISKDFQEHFDVRSNISYLNEYFSNITYWVGLSLFAIFCLTSLYVMIRFWQWYQGNDVEICHCCGGMVTEKNGRFGRYYKCLACGNNRSIYR